MPAVGLNVPYEVLLASCSPFAKDRGPSGPRGCARPLVRARHAFLVEPLLALSLAIVSYVGPLRGDLLLVCCLATHSWFPP